MLLIDHYIWPADPAAMKPSAFNLTVGVLNADFHNALVVTGAETVVYMAQAEEVALLASHAHLMLASAGLPPVLSERLEAIASLACLNITRVSPFYEQRTSMIPL